MKKISVCIRLTEDMHRWLKTTAAEQGISMCGLVEDIITEHKKREQKKEARKSYYRSK